MKQESLKEKAYHTIKSKIINAQILPNSFLDEAQLVKEIGASRTPIREALNKLEQENLVKIFPKRGVLVCDLTLNEVNEVYETRQLVEPYIILNYAFKIETSDLQAARDQILNNTHLRADDAIYKADNDLHQLIIESSQNSYLIDMMEKIYDQNHRIRILSGKKINHRLDETNEEHLLVFDCLLNRDMESAAKAMLDHLEKSKNAAINAMLTTGSHMLSINL